MYNDFPKLLSMINEIGIEATLQNININEIDDSVVKIILRTIDNSIQRLREELN